MDRCRISDDMLRSLADLSRSEGEGRIEKLLPELMSVLQSPTAPSDLDPGFDLSRWRRVLGRGPLVPSHGDLHPGNVIVSEDRWTVVDADPQHIDMRPFWFDAVTLIGSSRSEFLEGRFDSQLQDLWSTAGLADVDISKERDVIAVAWCLCYHPLLWRSKPETNRLALAPDPWDYAAERWKRLWQPDMVGSSGAHRAVPHPGLSSRDSRFSADGSTR